MKIVYEGKNESINSGCTCNCNCYCLEDIVQIGLWYDADVQYWGEWAFPS